MKKFILIIFFSSLAFANINIVVSITPEVSMVKAIGGDKTDVKVMVPRGASPHTYAPKPKDMIKLSSAKLYFAIGVEFEKSWLEKFKQQNPKMKIVNLSDDIKKINNNPHIWLSTDNLQTMAKEICKNLINTDKENQSYYEKNLNSYLEKLKRCKNNIIQTIKTKKNKSFMTFHPAFTYFAHEFNLTQISIEVDGKEPGLKELLKIIKEAKHNNIKTIITSPEFSDKSAKVIANELDAKVIRISPLSPDICNTIKLITNSLK